jgi:uncharacterized RDD family membrane protein YckC
VGDGRIWHYIDGNGTQVGPVDAADVEAALRDGRLPRSGLAWREGMATWQPVGELAEFGGASVGAVPPPPPASGPTNPYAPMPHAHVPREAVDDIVYAGFLRRWAALWLDQLILAVPLVLLVFGLGLAGAVDGGDQAPSEGMAALVLLVYLLWFAGSGLYYALQESSAAQATLGKRALGIKVTDAQGRRIGFGHALGRWFATALSYLTFYVGFLLAAGTPRKQALHDFVAGTLVVDKWAYTAHPERQKRQLSGCLVAFLLAVLMVPVLAILAAISISQYQDYVLRSQVSEGSSLADGVKTAVGEYVDNRGEFPPDNAAAGLAAPASITGAYVGSVNIGGEPGRIDVVYSARAPQRAKSQLDGRTLYFVGEPGPGSITWTCVSDDLPQKWCPSSCQCHGQLQP